MHIREMGDVGQPAEIDGLDVSREGALALLTVNRPRARNALTRSMRSRIASALPALARDPQLYCMVIGSAVPGVFSAGGDVREMADLARSDLSDARRALAEEYALNWLLECFSKPTVSLLDGLVMGSGVGISVYGTHRIAGERYVFAMPECAIGLFPDDGVAHILARLPDSIGMYLGLTGRRIGRADAYRLGLATHCIAGRHYPGIIAALKDAQPVDPMLDGLHEDPGEGELAPYHETIARCFSAPNVPELLDRLATERGSARAWTAGVIADLSRCSPTSLTVTHRHISEAAARDLRQTLTIDYRLASRMIEHHDFQEGVRATLIEKDGNPRWRPATLAEITPGAIDRLFQPMPGEELVLPTRQEMQAARV